MKQVSLQVLNVVMLLQEACNGVQEFSHQEIQRMIGILRTNGMKLEPHGTGTLNILFHRFSRFLKEILNSNDFFFRKKSHFPLPISIEISSNNLLK